MSHSRTQLPRPHRLAFAAIGALAIACSGRVSDDSSAKDALEGDPCPAGEERACDGVDDCVGQRSCLPEGAWGGCDCGDTSDQKTPQGSGGEPNVSGTGGGPLPTATATVAYPPTSTATVTPGQGGAAPVGPQNACVSNAQRWYGQRGLDYCPSTHTCLCATCGTDYGYCQSAPGCMDIVQCALAYNVSAALDVYNTATCMAVVDGNGGPFGEAASVATAFSDCFNNPGNNCPLACPTGSTSGGSGPAYGGYEDAGMGYGGYGAYASYGGYAGYPIQGGYDAGIGGSMSYDAGPR